MCTLDSILILLIYPPIVNYVCMYIIVYLSIQDVPYTMSGYGLCV